MEQQSARLRNTGFLTFFFSGICAISAGVVVSLLQEEYGFAYGMTGTLLSLMSIGNLIAGFLVGVLPGALGMKRSVLLLTKSIRRWRSPCSRWSRSSTRRDRWCPALWAIPPTL